MASKGKRLTHLTSALGVLVLLIAGYAFWDKAVEQWYIWKLGSVNLEDQKSAAEKLANRGSMTAIPLLLEILRQEPERKILRYDDLHYSQKALGKIVSDMTLRAEQQEEEGRFVEAYASYAEALELEETAGLGGSERSLVPYLVGEFVDKIVREESDAVEAILRSDLISSKAKSGVISCLSDKLYYEHPEARDVASALREALKNDLERIWIMAAEALKIIQSESRSDGR